MRILGIEHIAIAVDDSGGPTRLFEELLGITGHVTEEIPDQKVITNIFNTGRGKVELLTATSPDSPISRFLANKGPGLHHLALEVDDLAAWLAHLSANGVELIDTQPRIGAEGNLIAFLHPKATSGVLIELCQKPSV